MKVGERRKNTFQANCPHCGTKQVAFQAKTEIVWKRDNLVEVLDIAAQCGQCRRAIIAAYAKASDNNFRYNGELYPHRDVPAAPLHTPDNVARFYIQGLDNLSRNWDAAGSMFRKALETGLRAKFPNKTGTLYDRIESAERASKLTPEMAKWAHQIRKLGNSAIHDEEPWTKEEAQEIKDFTELVFQYLFTLPGKMKKAQPEPEQEQ